MATPTDQELKEKAASYLKRVSEIANSATKTALISFGALAIIWFTQIRPQYKQLLEYVYPAFNESNGTYVKIEEASQELRSFDKRLNDSRRNARLSDREAAPAAGSEERLVEAGKVKHLRDINSEKKKALNVKRSELESLVKSVSFDVFGLKMPVPPLYASVVWNLLLLVLLMYLAQARSSVWILCAAALSMLKRMSQKPEALDDVAGSGPMWLAPLPSRLGKASAITAEDLRSAFGWSRLETLPSTAATAGFLLLSLLQLAVTSQGYQVINAARDFTAMLTTIGGASAPQPDPPPYVLKQKISELSNRLTRDGDAGSSSAGTADTYLIGQQITELTVDRTEASLLYIFLFLTLAGTTVLVVGWFRQWRVAGRLAGELTPPHRLAKLLLLGVAGLSLCLLIGWLQPELGLTLGAGLTEAFPHIIRFLAGSVVAFCLIELFAVALFTRKTPGHNG